MSDEIDEVVTFPTLDEAIARAMADVGDDGGIVCVHAGDCEIDDDGEGCDCEVLTLEVGAKA